MGLAQCQDRFVARRWNCSVQPAHFSYFLTATQQGETVHTSAQVTQYALSHTHTCSITQFYPHFYLAPALPSLNHTLPPIPLPSIIHTLATSLPPPPIPRLSLTPPDTPEAAYVQAITGAGMMSAVSRQCKRNQLQKCSCDSTPKTPPPDRSFFWGGCGDNHDYGYTFSKQFSAGAVQSGTALSVSELMSQHNSEAGRMVSGGRVNALLISSFCISTAH